MPTAPSAPPRRLRPPMLLLVAALATGSCGGASTGEGSAGTPGGATGPSAAGSQDTLRVALYHWPASLNPHLAPTAEDFDIYHQTFEGLVDLDGKQEIVGRLAERFTFSPDGKELTFHLRQGVTWHDGKPFTAQDVVFTHKSLTTWADLSYRPLMAEVVSVEAKDPHTVVVKYKQPFAPALSTWTVPVLPAHHFPAGTSYADASSKFPGIGTGPYRIVRKTEGELLELERHPDYRRPVPFFSGIVFKMMKDSSDAVRAIRDGELDVVRMRHADWKYTTMEGDWEHILTRVSCATHGYSFIGWNQDGSNPFFEDRRIRRALAMAFDRDQARIMYTSGMAEMAWGPYDQSSPYFDPTLGPLPLDKQLAGRELDMTGFIDHDGDGYRDRDGVMLRFKLLTLDGMLFGNEMAFLMIEDLKAVGVKLEHVRVSPAEMMQRLKDGKFDAFLLEWSGDADPDLFSLFHSSQHGDGQNYVSYSNPEVDALLDEGRRTLDAGRRRDIYRKAHALIYGDQPYLFLLHMPTLWAVSSRIEGLEAQHGGLLTAYPGLLQWRATRPPARLSVKPKPREDPMVDLTAPATPPPAPPPDADIPPSERKPQEP